MYTYKICSDLVLCICPGTKHYLKLLPIYVSRHPFLKIKLQIELAISSTRELAINSPQPIRSSLKSRCIVRLEFKFQGLLTFFETDISFWSDYLSININFICTLTFLCLGSSCVKQLLNGNKLSKFLTRIDRKFCTQIRLQILVKSR